MRLHRYILPLLLIALPACHKAPADQPLSPQTIAFAPGEGSMTSQRPLGMPRRVAQADRLPLETYFQTFDVYAYKNIGDVDSVQTVMEGYRVHWTKNSEMTSTTNTHGWEYVGQQSVLDTTQTVKYWDYDAFSYRFGGITSVHHKDATHPSGYTHAIKDSTDGVRYLHIHLPELISGLDVAHTEASTGIYYSRMNVVNPRDHATLGTRMVEMEFVKLLSRVSIGFIFGADISSQDALPLEDIALRPCDETAIPKQGAVDIFYPLTGTSLTETVQAEPPTGTLDSLTFDDMYYDIMFDQNGLKPNGTDPDIWSHQRFINTKSYFVLPQEGKDYQLGVTYRGQRHTAVLPAAYMHWDPNFQYTYIFKIVEPAHFELLFIDVEVAPWKEGGYLEDEEHHW